MGVVKKRLICLAVAIAVPIVAAAQQNQLLRDRDPDLAGAKKLAADLQRANFHYRSLYVLSRFRISDAGYTEGGFIPTGDQDGGVSLSVEAPHTLYYVPHKKVIFGVQAVPGYSFFRESDKQFNYLLRADAHFLLNHVYLNAYAIRADQLRAHVADINRLATAREDEIGLTGELKYSSRTSALFTARQRDTSYPTSRFQPDRGADAVRVPLEVLNRKERTGRVSLLHRTFPRTSLFASGELSDYEFVNKRAYDSRRTLVGGGVAYDGGRTQVRLEAGPMRLDFKDPLQRDYSGLTAQGRVTRTDGRWTYSAGADRDLGFSVFLDNAYYVATSGYVGADYTATRKITLHTRVSGERDEYETPVLGRERTDDISFSSIGFTYAVRHVSAGVDVGWYERQSTAFGDEASGIRYVFRLSLIP